MTCSTLPRGLSPCKFKNTRDTNPCSRSMCVGSLIRSRAESSGTKELLSGWGVISHQGEPGHPESMFRPQRMDGVGMSRSQLVAEHLPLLRRYARALTGNQASGDAYVGAMLEALLQDSSLLDEQHGPRAGLFRLFTQIWNSVALNDNADVATLPMPPERRLSNINPSPRQAFLLLSLEGFSAEEVAYILGTDIAETRKLADAAGREMAPHTATPVLIIEAPTSTPPTSE